jgi:hypothetical protein
MSTEIKLQLPDGNTPGYILLLQEIEDWRARIKDVSASEPKKFWDEFAVFAARFIVEPTDAAEKARAVKMLSHNQVNQILDVLSGKAFEQAAPPLPTPPSSSVG